MKTDQPSLLGWDSVPLPRKQRYLHIYFVYVYISGAELGMLLSARTRFVTIWPCLAEWQSRNRTYNSVGSTQITTVPAFSH